MKEAKVIHINDGTSVELTNGNRHYAEDITWAGKMLTMYLNHGYEIHSIIPDYSPSVQGKGGYNFFKTGFTAIMIREKSADSVDITAEDWERENMEECPYTYEDYKKLAHDIGEEVGFDFSSDENEDWFFEEYKEYDEF